MFILFRLYRYFYFSSEWLDICSLICPLIMSLWWNSVTESASFERGQNPNRLGKHRPTRDSVLVVETLSNEQTLSVPHPSFSYIPLSCRDNSLRCCTECFEEKHFCIYWHWGKHTLEITAVTLHRVWADQLNINKTRSCSSLWTACN